MTVTINGTTGIDKVQPGVVTSSSLASGQTLAVNGIAFPASQSASSDANTLDDYEEGTFTPTLTPTTSGAFTYNKQDGWYTKVGNLVHVVIGIQANKNTASGGIVLTNLPFQSKSGAPHRGISYDWYLPGGGTAVNCVGIIDPASTYITMCKTGAASNDGSAATWNATDVSTQVYFWLDFSYLTS